MVFTLLTVIVFSSSVLSSESPRQLRTIYGKDNRQEEADVTNAILKASATATVALVKHAELKLEGNEYKIQTSENLKTRYGPTQCGGKPWRFATQALFGYCSGTLITPTVIATAGHCIPDQKTCDETFFVFHATNETVASRSFPQNTVFQCKEIILTRNLVTNGLGAKGKVHNVNIGIGGFYTGTKSDYGVMRLTVAVPKEVATPVKVRSRGKRVAMNEQVTVVGHPSGGPRKYTQGTVNFVGPIQPTGSYSFAAPFSTFGGNSGSGVFVDATGEMVGIHVAGGFDTKQSETENCYEFRVCPNQTAPMTSLSKDVPQDMTDKAAVDAFEKKYFDLAACGGEWQEGSTALGPILIQENGCASSDDCLNGGTCKDKICQCRTGFFGADCSQAKSRALCNGLGENTAYLTCTGCAKGTSPPYCNPCGANNLMDPVGCYRSPVPSAKIPGCMCSANCQACGFSESPVGDDDCIVCFVGSTLTPKYPDGSGVCSAPSVPKQTQCNEGAPEIDRCGKKMCFVNWDEKSQQDQCVQTLTGATTCSDSTDPATLSANLCGDDDAPSMKFLFRCPGATPPSNQPTAAASPTAATSPTSPTNPEVTSQAAPHSAPAAMSLQSAFCMIIANLNFLFFGLVY